MISFSRRNRLAARSEAERSGAKPPTRYDRRFVFLLLLLATVFILSHAVLERRYEPTVGLVIEEDIYAPPGFLYLDELGAQERRREEFDRSPEPYRFSDAGFDAAADRLRGYFSAAADDSPVAALVIPQPARRARVLRRVEELIERTRREGLLEKAYPSPRTLYVRDRDGFERTVSSDDVMQPGRWDRYLAGLDEDEIARVSGLLDKHLMPTLKYDEERARALYEEVTARHPAERVSFSTERPIIPAGQELGPRQVEILRQLQDFLQRRNSLMLLSLVGIVTLTLVFGVLFLKHNLPALYERVRDVSAISFAFGAVLLLSYLVRLVAGRVEIGTMILSNAVLPVASLAMILTLLYDIRVAVLFSLLASALVSIVLAPRAVLLVMFIFGSLTGAMSAASARRRSDLFRSGLWISGVQLAVVVLVGLLQGEPILALRADMVSAILSGFLCALLTQALLLPLEAISHRVSAFTLLELADLNHPLLQLLLRKAPGTFQHSQHVALLAQSAAEAIGANSLLTRVGAYFHDIGKMEKPEYFTENQSTGENPHDRLKPSLSAAVIRNHILDGAGLAEQERLPEPVIDFIWQHQGTGVMSIFYHRALEQAGEEGDVNRGDFQYPGPRPQTPEVGIMMLADAVEAAGRSIPNPTAAKLERMVKKVIADIFESGQLDECELTLKDLTVIAEEFTRVLCGMYHTRRVEYPDAEEIEEAEKKKQN